MGLRNSVLFPGDPIIFPDGFVLLEGLSEEEQRKRPIAIGSFDEQQVVQAMLQKTIEMMTNLGSQILFEKIKIEIWERPYWLALQVGPQQFTIFDSPLESRSKGNGSNAVYYAASGKWGLLIQYIPPNSRTSAHDHLKSGWIETNHPLAGRAKLYTYENRQQQVTHHLTIANPISPVIEPCVLHQICTENQSLLNIIEIIGDPDWFKKWKNGEGHTFKPFPQ